MVTLASLLLTSWIAARILVRVDAHAVLLNHGVAWSRGRPARLVLAIMALTFLLSLVIPNVITVLAVLPLVKKLLSQLPESERPGVGSVLMLAVLFAANIGGLGSLTGSPHNALLIGALTTIDAPQRELLTFGRWLLMGLPMGAGMVAIAWATLVLLSKKKLPASFDCIQTESPPMPVDRRRGVRVLATLGCGVVVASWVGGTPVHLALVAVAVLASFLTRLPERGEPLLRPRDLVDGIPLRGVAFLALAVAVGAVLQASGAVDLIRDAVLSAVTTPRAAIVVPALLIATIFLTEVVSNTAAAVAMWWVADALATSGGFDPFLSFMAVGLASSCAFMSPVATPATGMAFGSFPGASLSHMVRVGLVVNVLAIGWLWLMVETWIPATLGLYT